MHPNGRRERQVETANQCGENRNSLGESSTDCYCVVRHEAFCLTTILRRLLWVASFRASNCYRHPVIAVACGEQQTSRELRAYHHEVFLQWLCLTLREQQAQLDEYLPTGENPRREIIQSWIRSSIIDVLVPSFTSEADRRLFQLDFGYGLAMAYASLDREEPKRLPFSSTTQIRLVCSDSPMVRRLKAMARIRLGLETQTKQ